MAIFVTGASGYIGSAVVHELTVHGFEVRGLSRSEESSAAIGRLEAVAVRGDLADTELLSRAAATHEVVIHCATDHGADRWELEHAAVAAMIDGASGARRPRLFIYTSGVWVYGSSPELKTEGDVPTPPALVAPRLDVEARVLRGTAGNLVTSVVRPGCVYGGAGGLTAAWFERARAWGAARVVGPAEHRWAMVHRADLAYLYRRLVETHLGGIWNAVDSSRDSIGACAEAAGRAVGHDGSIEVVPVEVARTEIGPFADCLALDQQVSSAKAHAQLGWSPRHTGFVAGARQLAAAWRAHAR